MDALPGSTKPPASVQGLEFDVGTGDAINRLPNLLKNAQKVLKIDKSHLTFAYLLIDDRIVAHLPIAFADQDAKRLAFQRLANEIRVARADGFIFAESSGLHL